MSDLADILFDLCEQIIATVLAVHRSSDTRQLIFELQS